MFSSCGSEKIAPYRSAPIKFENILNCTTRQISQIQWIATNCRYCKIIWWFDMGWSMFRQLSWRNRERLGVNRLLSSLVCRCSRRLWFPCAERMNMTGSQCLLGLHFRWQDRRSSSIGLLGMADRSDWRLRRSLRGTGRADSELRPWISSDSMPYRPEEDLCSLRNHQGKEQQRT